MSEAQKKQPVMRVLDTEGQQAQAQVEQLEQRIAKLKQEQKELREAKKVLRTKTVGMSVSLNEYTDKEGQKRVGLSIRGLSARPVFLFGEQALRICGNTPEAEANREAVRQFIEQEKANLTWKK